MKVDQKNRGLYGKFYVERNDGRDLPGGDRTEAEYLVLDLTYDPPARSAAWSYAEAVEKDYPLLAEDIRGKLIKLMDAQKLKQCIRNFNVNSSDEIQGKLDELGLRAEAVTAIIWKEVLPLDAGRSYYKVFYRVGEPCV